jgi:hypothetical protein
MSKKKVEIGSLVKFYHSDSIEAVTGIVVELHPYNMVSVLYNGIEYAIHTSAIRNGE